MKRIWAQSGFRALLIGQGVSALGDWMVTVALLALVLQISDSATAVGAILVLRLIPAALAGPLAARAAGRWDRRRTMLAMDATRAAMVALVPLVSALWWIYLWAFMLELLSIVFLPARDASIPDLIDRADLPVANGLVLGSSYGTIPLGAGAFAAVAALSPARLGFLGHHPYALVFWVDALTYLVSFFFIRRLTVLGPAVSGVEDHAGVAGSHGFLAAFRIPLVRQIIPAVVTVSLGLGALFSLGVSYVEDVLHAGSTEFGILIALFGVGAGLGLGALRLFPGQQLASVRWGVAVQGATIALMALAHSLVLGFLGATVFGGATAFTLAAGMSALQETLDGEQRVLAFAAFHVVIRAGLAVSAIGAGVAADVVGTVRLGMLGRIPPASLVLFFAGVLVFVSSSLVRQRVEAAGPPSRPPQRQDG